MSEPQQQNKSEKQQQPQARLQEFTIEICAPQNNTVYFAPTKEILRGRTDMRTLPVGTQSSVGILQTPVCPGLHIRIDPVNMVGQVIDPLSKDPELMASISNAHVAAGQKKRSPVPTITRKLDRNGVATWAYWMIRLVNDGLARADGRSIVPTLDELKRVYGDAQISRQSNSLEGSKPEVLAEVAA